MIALDTNVLVRVLTRDDAEQAHVAAAALASGPVFVATTVLLELEWVLRFSYGFDQVSIRSAIVTLLGLPNLTVDDLDAVVGGLDAYAAGLDFADALHLTTCPAAVTEVVTFDRKFSRRAENIHGVVPVRLLDRR